MLPMQKLLDAAAKEYPNLTRDELTALIGLSIEVRQNQIKNEMKRAKKSIGKAKGGNIAKQMELFQDGGLKEEGNTKDPVSGNDVPPGATQEEVRDDIPAQLSEGEFVFPADVVRYIGLEKLMQMRQDAKMGLKIMEDMGQMGNADEATLPDDIPFSIIDIKIAEGEDTEVDKKAEGGVIKAANGFSGTTTTNNPVQMRPANRQATPTGLRQQYTAPQFDPTVTQNFTRRTEGFSKPITKFTYKGDQVGDKATYKGLLGGDEFTQGPDEYRTFVNDEGVEIQIPFKNGELFTGFTIPEGFKQKTEEVDTAKVQTARIKSARVDEEGGESSDPTSVTGGASLAFGGDKSGAGKGLQSNAITGNISYNINPMGKMGVLSGLMTINDINKGKDVATIGNKNGIVTNPVEVSFGKGKVSLTSKEYANIKNNPTGKAAKDLKGRLQVLNSIVERNYTIDPRTNLYTDPLGNTISTEQAEQAGKDIQDMIAQDVSKGKDATKSLASKSKTEISMAMDYGIVDEDDQQDDDRTDQQQQAIDNLDFGATDPNQGSSLGIGKGMGELSDDPPDDDGSTTSDASTDTGSVSEGGYGGVGATAKGGLIPRLKKKPKKMKRGGLASKK